MRIHGWAADFGACRRYRLELPFGVLGADSTVHEDLTKCPWVKEALPTDVLVGQRVTAAVPTDIWQRAARLSDRPTLVYELDDDLLDIPQADTPMFEYFSVPGNREAFVENIRVADAVTVSTPRLAERVAPINANVTVLENCIPAALLDVPLPVRDPRTVRVGWSGSQTHRIDVETIGAPLRRFLARNPKATLVTLGADYRRLLRCPGQHTSWIRDADAYHQFIGSFDVGLAPLRPHPFNAAKSWLRVLELAALGVPVVAADYGEYARFVDHGVTGFLARRDHEWEKYLRELVNDPGMRAEMGQAARQKAAEWTYEEHGHRWQAVYDAVTTTASAA